MRQTSGLLMLAVFLPLLPAMAQGMPPVLPPRLINIPTPSCKAGNCHGAHGLVRLIVDVMPDGKVGDVRAELGDDRLIEAATAIAYQAEFLPGRFQGEPKNMNYVLNLHF
ncbi:energy transducer TonB [Granulicella sp. L60]|jgi:hypothetical protein|uniref:energy transducer TonB n=1 Tax=Granulicella sp. L60 TaxID=1641866 RepID=UPI00131E7348|nr:energy transducer TonB [Granulicella sp. L60]